jgi:hypothetical protein
MARFELTLSNGEKILVDHHAVSMEKMLTEMEGNAFVLVTEVQAAAAAPPKQVMVATRQITLMRLGGENTRGSDFKGKRV